ncbi:hypothetical protein [Streptomyces microflavus]|uniref:hypothetical protein n=1 Tax=Streptomyces microflavus TaxID=1919 RepID=UPI003688E86F
MSSVDWGDAPTWIAAVFAGGAALFAGLTIRSQRQQIAEQRAFIGEQSQNLQLERALLRAQADDRRHEQARALRVRARTSWTNLSDEGDAGPDDHWLVTVQNGSDEPITDVWVRFGDTYTARDATQMNESGRSVGTPRGVPLSLIGPRRGFRFTSSALPEATLANMRPSVLFRDAAGVRWRLDDEGALQEITDDVTG